MWMYVVVFIVFVVSVLIRFLFLSVFGVCFFFAIYKNDTKRRIFKTIEEFVALSACAREEMSHHLE